MMNTYLPADSTQTVAKAAVSSAKEVTKPVSKKTKTDGKTNAKQGTRLSHADSAYFFVPKAQFADQCLTSIDINECLTTSSWSTSPLNSPDNVAQNDSTISHTHSITTLSLAERGTTPLRQYADSALISAAAVIILILIVRVTNSSIFKGVFEFFTDGPNWKKLENDNSSQTVVGLSILHWAYFILLAVFCLELCIAYQPDLANSISTFSTTLKVSAGIIVLYTLRHVLDVVIGFAFDMDKKMHTIRLYKKTAGIVLGICMFPCVIISPFMTQASYTTILNMLIVVICLVTVFRIVKTIKINLADLPTIFYSILYLCIAEVAPIVCLIRLAQLQQV